jgi:hypothetical protein
MKRVTLMLVIPLLVAACATMQSQTQELVSRGLQAVGGADALAGVKTYYEKGSMKHWDPESSHVPGGEARFAADVSFETVVDVGARTAATDMSKKLVYPSPRQYTFTEVVAPEAGYVWGIDATGRTRQSLEAKPPAHSMSGIRLTTAQRELRRTSPLLLLDMHRSPDRVKPVADVTVGGIAYPAVEYQPAANQTLIVMFDRASGRPARIRTLDYDNILGDVTYDAVLSDWKAFEGVQIATRRKYELNGRLVADIQVTDARPNASFASDRLEIPEAFRSRAAKPATGTVPFQWVIRRQFIGAFLDSDVPSFDTQATSSLRLAQVAPGVQHVVGGTHHTLLVEMKDHLVVLDAPVSDWHSTWVIGAAQVKYTGKPIKYLVLTHHHMDHAGGMRAYLAQGATLVVGKGAGEHFRKVLAMPFTRNPDLATKDLSRTSIIEVADRHVLSDGQREVHAYLVNPNPHSEALLIGYLPHARLGFVTDLWSPGGAPLGERLNPSQAALVAAVKKAGIAPEKFAGGHGSVGDYAPLAALEGK